MLLLGWSLSGVTIIDDVIDLDPLDNDVLSFLLPGVVCICYGEVA